MMVVQKKKRTKRDWDRLLAPFLCGAVRVFKSADPTTSYFGSLPPAFEGFVWPMNSDGIPLSFLACIDCKDMADFPDMGWLPNHGRLLFFYETQLQPWGFEPEHRDSFSVIFVMESQIENEAMLSMPPSGFPDGFILKKAYLDFVPFYDFPPSESLNAQGLALSFEEMDFLDEVRHSSPSVMYPLHQLGGYPIPVQRTDMAVLSQLVSHGISCGRDPTESEEARISMLEEGASDWALLFQMDSDEEMDVIWNDFGRLYFWIRRQDAKDLKFERAWMIQQTH